MRFSSKESDSQRKARRATRRIATMLNEILKTFRDRVEFMQKNEFWIERNILKPSKNKGYLLRQQADIAELRSILHEEKKIIQTLKLEEKQEDNLISYAITFIEDYLKHFSGNEQAEMKKALRKKGFKVSKFIDICKYTIKILEEAQTEAKLGLVRVKEEEIYLKTENTNLKAFYHAWRDEMEAHKKVRIMLEEFRRRTSNLLEKFLMIIGYGGTGGIMGWFAGYGIGVTANSISEKFDISQHEAAWVGALLFLIAGLSGGMIALGKEYLNDKKDEIRSHQIITNIKKAKKRNLANF